MICVFVGFSRVFLLGILIFKGLTARRLYKSFGVKGLKHKYKAACGSQRYMCVTLGSKVRTNNIMSIKYFEKGLMVIIL
jgi:hypothetical protein